MKKIGIVGGLAWPSTMTYYQTINEEIARLEGDGKNHCARMVISQTDFDEIERNQAEGNWQHVGELIAAEAASLKAAGADFFIIACNTVHMAYPYIMEHTDLPNIHIVDPVAEAAIAKGIGTVGLIGTGYTMEEDYFKGRLRDKYGLKVIVPEPEEIKMIHRVLFAELVKDIVLPETKQMIVDVIGHLADRGAQSLILGCTEFGLMLHQEDSPIPLLDTTIEHAKAAAAWAMDD